MERLTADELFADNDFLRRLRAEAYKEALSAIRREVSDVNKEFLLEVAKGNVPGHSIVHKFGRNPDCDPATSATAVPVARDVWDGGIAGATAWVPPTTARVHQLASSNDEDGGAGTDTGALTLRVSGLDASYHLINADYTLNGTTNVPTAAMTMIYRMKVLTAGSAGRNLGNITATADTDGTVTAKITIDMNQTLMAIYQVPAGKTAYVISWDAGLGRAGSGSATYSDGFLMSKDFGGVWAVKDTATISRDGQSHVTTNLDLSSSYPAKSYIKVAQDPSAVAQDVHGGFSLLLVDDGR